MPAVSQELLRRDVRMLGDLLGQVITDQVGPEALALVEEVRHLSRRRRNGEHEVEPLLAAKLAGISLSEARVLARAFAVFFDLANLAEDRHRVRVLRSREQEKYPEPISESIAAGIARLKELDFSAEQVQTALDHLAIELVFTAHPSEAKRRSIRAKLRRMKAALQECDRDDLLPREKENLEAHLRGELTVLWQTDFLRQNRPTVLQEVERGLSITPRLWEVAPQVYETLRQALQSNYPDAEFQVPVFLRFGSWMGGDRDGNPNVTAPITAQTLVWQRDTALRQHLAWCRRMYDFLSISVREGAPDDALSAKIDELCVQFPELKTVIEPVASIEICRRWITMMEWRLGRSFLTSPRDSLKPGGYRDGAEFTRDLKRLQDSLRRSGNAMLASTEAQKWVDLAEVFGLHLTCLDVRQDARRYREVMGEILAAIGVTEKYGEFDETQRAETLSRTIPWTGPIPTESLSPLARDTLALFEVLSSAMNNFGPACLGGHVVSLTQCPSDLLSVLWLWRWICAQNAKSENASSGDELRIVPLFEKIDDLRRAASTLASILEHPLYREHLSRQKDRQIVMVGYSDSTKDGGYLAACWGLFESQSQLHEVAAAHGVQLTFFHGRGGSLGRGGGPAERGILSLPPSALDGSLRLTEQGEVLAERYDDPQVAFRHLEQVTWATLIASATPGIAIKPSWRKMMEEISQSSLATYRDLVDQPGFIRYFESATPIEEIENLPIGSRPSRRRGERTLGDLRAIPWVFSWTQNRCLIPAWYGLGNALSEVKYRDRASWQTICEMYRFWPFFRATIDNAALALAKSDTFIAQHYSELTEDADGRQRCWQRIAREFDRTRQAILDLVGGHELLGTTPWLMSSIDARNPYIDPLNLMQVELLKRRRTLPPEATEEEMAALRDLLRLTVQGIAAGMRTTG